MIFDRIQFMSIVYILCELCVSLSLFQARSLTHSLVRPTITYFLYRDVNVDFVHVIHWEIKSSTRAHTSTQSHIDIVCSLYILAVLTVRRTHTHTYTLRESKRNRIWVCYHGHVCLVDEATHILLELEKYRNQRQRRHQQQLVHHRNDCTSFIF